jgi:Carboxypeptidase regulatory-like domain
MRFRSHKSSYSSVLASVAVRLISLGLIASRPVAVSLFWRRAFRRETWLWPHFVLVFVPLFLRLITPTALARRQPAEPGINRGALAEEEPRAQSGAQNSSEQTPSAEGASSVSGVVLDVSRAVVPGATVTLTSVDRTKRQTVMSGANGEFTFTKVLPGSYVVIVEAKGFDSFASATFVLTGQQNYEVPRILLPVATESTQVVVHTTEAIAAVQVKAEEKQRILGIVPNFYTTYLPDAAPLTTKQKFSLASRDTFDPISLIGVGIAAGIQQANNSYAGYGQGAAGYGKRFAAQFGNGRSSDFLSHAVFPSLFHQDPRYFYQGTGTFRSRFIHAISYAVIARSDSGRPMPNYSYFLGDIVSGGLSNLYYPHADRGIGLVFTNAAIGIAGKAGGAILREFFSKRLTTNVPAGNGKP